MHIFQGSTSVSYLNVWDNPKEIELEIVLVVQALLLFNSRETKKNLVDFQAATVQCLCSTLRYDITWTLFFFLLFFSTNN